LTFLIYCTDTGIAATGTAAHVRALGCLPSKNMGALRPTTNKNNVTIMTRSAIVSPEIFKPQYTNRLLLNW